jgi:hypothetical protein
VSAVVSDASDRRPAARAAMTGSDYANLIAAYLSANFADRGLVVYREVNFGKSIIGKNRRLDVLALDSTGNKALAIECKYQGTAGTTDEKVPYTLQDIEAMGMPACAAYAGEGWSSGVRHMLASSAFAAYCLPDAVTLARSDLTRELDHILAQTFSWWDVLLHRRTPFDLEAWRATRVLPHE